MTQTKTSADRGSTPLESTTLEEKMKKYLNNKWFTFACVCFNFYFAAQSFVVGNWLMFTACSVFTVICGYSFWHQMGEE